jgi:hypothetical protein
VFSGVETLAAVVIENAANVWNDDNKHLKVSCFKHKFNSITVLTPIQLQSNILVFLVIFDETMQIRLIFTKFNLKIFSEAWH